MASRHVTVATFNVHSWRTKGYEGSVEQCLSVLQPLQADIIGLQEAVAYDKPGDIQRVSRELSMEYVFGESGEMGKTFGNAILSRYPILFSQNIRISEDTTMWQTPRACLYAKVDHPHGIIHAFCSHLEVKDEKIRLCQVGVLLDFMHEHVPQLAEPIVLMTDMNTVRLSDYDEVQLSELNLARRKCYYDPLEGAVVERLDAAGLTDAWHVAHATDCELATVWTGTRVDFIWGRNVQFIPGSCRPIPSRASDHNCVTAQLLLPADPLGSEQQAPF
eukprot:TRINITY_DN10553_c0_g1_i1.p1 TRINITY_DN10553_c0_g1~~TRINITY_DN10553_c0_g1_i1.p1  ORF type:complete len:275 (-),score=31.33 TRINITY_DN10553_c0_g1_i1:790-1614(-)